MLTGSAKTLTSSDGYSCFFGKSIVAFSGIWEKNEKRKILALIIKK